MIEGARHLANLLYHNRVKLILYDIYFYYFNIDIKKS